MEKLRRNPIANRTISTFNGLNTWYPNNFKYITAISAFSES